MRFVPLMMIPRVVAVVLGTALTLAACSGAAEESIDAALTVPEATTSTTTATTTTTPMPELELIGPGPYGVGVTTITIEDVARERPLTVDVWFPLADEAVGNAHEYTFVPGIYYRSPTAITAEPVSMSPDGPFPLVVYSHGSGGQRWIHSNYTETIAAHGYVVVAADHTGNTIFELLGDSAAEFERIALNRPHDVSTVIDEMLDPASVAAAGIVEHVDPERVAVTGHSFGGFTALATVSGYDNELGSYEVDGRVDAIVPLAPASGPTLLSDDRLMAVDVPMLLVVGTDDETTPVDPNVTRPWEMAVGSPTIRVELIEAEHMTFSDVCDYVAFLPTLDAVPEFVTATLEDFAVAGCEPDDMAIDRAQALTNTFAITFLEHVFRDGPAIDATGVVVPDDVVLLVR